MNVNERQTRIKQAFTIVLEMQIRNFNCLSARFFVIP